MSTVPWPRLLVGPAGVVASASLYVYLTHWQVYPWFETRWPLGGLLASLALGVLAWQVVNRVSAWVPSLRLSLSHYAPVQPTDEEVR